MKALLSTNFGKKFSHLGWGLSHTSGGVTTSHSRCAFSTSHFHIRRGAACIFVALFQTIQSNLGSMDLDFIKRVQNIALTKDEGGRSR